MKGDINKKKFDEATKLKLEIFRECFKEWLPVFIHNPFNQKTYIYDFFAGSGQDIEQNPGSPLVLLQEAMGKDMSYCSKVDYNKVSFGFNESKPDKRLELEINVREHEKNCLSNCGREKCVYHKFFGNFEFKEAFERESVMEVLKNSKFGKFILLDQYGFKEVDNDIFLRLVNSPKTDFIFFISSSFIKRFKDHPNTVKYFQTNKINFAASEPKECHRHVANYFRSLIPENHEFYLHQFTIKKGSNYYGLIFGTGHTLGMEKFLKVCWEKDKMSGESNVDLYNDFAPNTLFYTETDTIKLTEFKTNLKSEILNGKIKNNLEGLKYSLYCGVPTNIFVELILELLQRKLISIEGKYNKKALNIHRFKNDDIYLIKLNSNGTV